GSWCQDSGQLPELRQGPQGARLQALASQPERQCSSAQERGGIRFNVTDYYSNQNQRDLVVGLADYLAKKLETLRPEEASAARVLRDLVKNQRLGQAKGDDVWP